ncbi:MAG: TetR/AcrR family transcriptional regulator [Nitratireductor sp.]|nr:TetR/AcrR family transcriptional regulator [Nitratireductor sp.]
MSRERQIIEAAIAVFARYGFRRTTMADIASESGISRQALYARFTSKHAIMTAAIAWFTEEKLARLETEWCRLDRLADKLDAYFRLIVVPYFEQLRAMPDFGDLLTGVSEESRAAKERAVNDKKARIASLFTPYGRQLGTSGSSPDALAELVVTSAEGFVFTARDRAHLDTLLSNLRQAALTLCASG